MLPLNIRQAETASAASFGCGPRSARTVRTAIIKAFLSATVALLCTLLRADETRRVPYEPAVVTLSGVIVEEGYGDDASPLDRGKHAWILRLDRPIFVPAKTGDEIDIEERNVTEIHLNVKHVENPISKDAFGTTRFLATGTLYHAITTHHLRPIVMLVSNLSPIRTKAEKGRARFR
jgi:hypothetical protein